MALIYHFPNRVALSKGIFAEVSALSCNFKQGDPHLHQSFMVLIWPFFISSSYNKNLKGLALVDIQKYSWQFTHVIDTGGSQLSVVVLLCCCVAFHWTLLNLIFTSVLVRSGILSHATMFVSTCLSDFLYFSLYCRFCWLYVIVPRRKTISLSNGNTVLYINLESNANTWWCAYCYLFITFGVSLHGKLYLEALIWLINN